MKLLNYFLSNLPETIIVFWFLAVAINFGYSKIKRLIVSFGGIFMIAIFTQTYINNVYLCALSGIFLITILWSILNTDHTIKSCIQVLMGTFCIFVVMFVCEFYIPFLMVYQEIDITNSTNEFLYSIPSRLLEIIFILWVYKRQANTYKLVANFVTILASSASAYSWWWVYEAKVPKCLRR